MRVKSATYVSRAAVGLIATSIFVWPTIGAESTVRIPDFSGLWAREYIGFEPPASGTGPIVNRSRLPSGQSNLRQLVGDYTNPILKPEASEIVKKRGEIGLTNVPAPSPSNQCLPMSPPFILLWQKIQVLQQEDRITILYAEDHQVRRVRMNQKHPAHVIPSWSGDAIGRFEGDTLVVDTIGIKVGPYSMMDWFGTPHSEPLHVIERYRLIDYEAAREAIQLREKESLHIDSTSGLGYGVAIDPNYKGKALQVQFTVGDEGTLTMPWSATITYQRALGDWVEIVCAENTHEYYNGTETNVPHADKPDF
jgi:hypothetical protein